MSETSDKLSLHQIWYGRDESPQQVTPLQAGPLTARLEGGDLRCVQLGEFEVVRRFYVAVRDQNWNTIPPQFSNFKLAEGERSFEVSFDASHEDQEIQFSWRGTVSGSKDGTIVYVMDGTCGATFPYNKIGICIHHPYRESAGRTYSGRTPQGLIDGTLPVLIGPQRLIDGIDIPLFQAVTNLTIELGDSFGIEFAFEGDLFEMEDHRNWTDAAFKTYSTPEELGFPHQATAGQHIRQTVTMKLTGQPPALRPLPDEVSLSIGRPTGGRIPSIGLGMASHGGDLAAQEADVLRAVRPTHLRADLDLGDPRYPMELARALRCCRQLGCGLEIAIFVGDAAESELALLAAAIEKDAPVVRFLVFHKRETSTDTRWVRLASQVLAGLRSRPSFAGGSNGHFVDLNRDRPDVAGLDELVYPIMPQMHASDDLSLIENLEAEAETVKTARSFADGRRIVISPVTLKPRFNAVATAPESEIKPGELPPQVDARQMSLFGAAWTMGSIKYLAESGASAVTYYETTGWRGVMETESGSPVPRRFPAAPRQVFPLYHVLADLGEWTGGELVACAPNAPLSVNGLAVRHREKLHVLVANMTSASQELDVGPLETPKVMLRELDDRNAWEAMFRPEQFRASRREAMVAAGSLHLTLAPYAVVRIDADQGS
jgi:D-apionolactonase